MQFLIAPFIAHSFRFSVVFASVWTLWLMGIGNAQISDMKKYPPSLAPPSPNSQPPENLYNQFYQLPFPVADTHAVWVMDDHSQPIVGATIRWVDGQKVSQSVSTDAQGFANMEALPVGWTKLVISRAGYLSQNKWVNVVPGRKLKEKIALGKPGDYMFPGTFHLFPVHDPKFRVILSERVDHQAPPQVLGTHEQREIEWNTLKMALPESLQPYAHHNNFPLPQDLDSQSQVLDKIQHSQYWEVGLITVVDGTAGDGWVPKGGWMFPDANIMIPWVAIKESELTQIVKQHGFEVKKLIDNNLPSQPRSWNLRVIYKGNVGPAFLYACSELHQALPVLSFQISATVGAEDNR